MPVSRVTILLRSEELQVPPPQASMIVLVFRVHITRGLHLPYLTAPSPSDPVPVLGRIQRSLYLHHESSLHPTQTNLETLLARALGASMIVPSWSPYTTGNIYPHWGGSAMASASPLFTPDVHLLSPYRGQIFSGRSTSPSGEGLIWS